MNVLFIYSVENALSENKPLSSPLLIQFGISYLSSFLKQNKHKTDILILSRSLGRKNYRLIDNKIKDFKPNLIGFTSVATEYNFISSMSKYIKINYSDLFLIIGGPHATLNPDEVIKDSFGALCIGEGEYPLLELANVLENNNRATGINNLWIKQGNIIEKNNISPFFNDLDKLPFPDREIWENYIDYEYNYFSENISVLLGRGCPYSCTYCCNHSIRQIAKGRYVRFRTPKNIIEEIRLIHKKYPLEKKIYLEVESFGVNKKWAFEICNELEKFNKEINDPIEFGLNIRITPGFDFEKLFYACRKANVLYLNIGLESGSEKVRTQILKRNYSNEDVIGTVELARKYKLNFNFYVMMGIPGETYKDFQETIKICRICQPNEILLSIFYPYPGTELFELSKKMGLLKNNLNIRMERRQVAIDLPDFNKRQIQKNYIWFNYNVYKNYKPELSLVLNVFIKYLRLNPVIDRLLTRIFHSSLIIKFKRVIRY